MAEDRTRPPRPQAPAVIVEQQSTASLEGVINLLRTENTKQSEEQVSEIKDINKNFEKFFDNMRAMAGDKEEERRDKKKKKEDDPEKPVGFKKSDFTGGFGIAGLLGAVGAAVTGFVVGVVDFFKNLIPKSVQTAFANLSKAFKRGATGATKVARAADGTFRAMSKMEKFFHSIGRVIFKITNVFKAIGSYISGGFTKVANGFKSAITFLSKPFVAINNALGSSQKGLGFMSKASATMKDFFSGIGNKLKPITEAFSKGGFLGKIFSFFRVLGTKLPVIGWIISGIMGIFSGFSDAAKEVGGFAKIVRFLTSGFGKFFGVIIGGLGDLVKSLISTVAGWFGLDSVEKFLDSFSFQEIIEDVFATLGNVLLYTIPDMFSGFVDHVQETFRMTLDNFLGIFRGIKDKFTNLLSGGLNLDNILTYAAGIPGMIFGTILDSLKNGVAHIFKLFGGDQIAEALNNFSFTDIIDNFFQSAKDGLMAGINWMVDGVKQSVEAVGRWFSGFGEVIAQKFNDVKSFFADFSVLDFAKKAISCVGDFFARAFDAIGEKISGAWSTLTEALQGATNSIVAKIKGLAGSVVDKIREFLGALVPSQDSFAGNFIPDAIYEFLGEPAPKPIEPPKVDNSQKNGDLESNAAAAMVAVDESKKELSKFKKAGGETKTVEYIDEVDDTAYTKEVYVDPKQQARFEELESRVVGAENNYFTARNKLTNEESAMSNDMKDEFYGQIDGKIAYAQKIGALGENFEGKEIGGNKLDKIIDDYIATKTEGVKAAPIDDVESDTPVQNLQVVGQGTITVEEANKMVEEAKAQLAADQLELARVQKENPYTLEEEKAEMFVKMSENDLAAAKQRAMSTAYPEGIKPLRNQTQPLETDKSTRGSELGDISKEINKNNGQNLSILSAPQTSNVTNNSNNTAAIIPQNQPTVDQNDRQWSMFGN